MRRRNAPPSAKSLIARADRLAAEWCKRHGRCAAAGEPVGGQARACSGRMEWAHLVSRGIRVVRHHPLNYLCLCNQHHREYTQRPDRWFRFVEGRYPHRWNEIDGLIRAGHQVDWAAVVAWYETALAGGDPGPYRPYRRAKAGRRRP